ncbi:hypothetical protein EJB05_17184, partial [Eragrostis curvula]
MTTTTASRILLLIAYSAAHSAAASCFTRLFSFGDSITDNGNWLRFASTPGTDASSAGPVTSSPYGETFFRRPNGRFCDGRIIIDRIADALALPFLTPYLAGNSSQDYAHGANFAVGGATALSKDYFTAKNLDDLFTPYPLQWQMAWFKNVTRMVATDEEGLRDVMASSLFLVGEIGGNDYNRALLRGRSVEEVTTYIPDVVAAVSASLMELIGLGAKTIVVPGNFPTGCSPGYLSWFQTNDTAQYDSMGCLRWPNHLSELHNRALNAELTRLRRRHPGVVIVYTDYYAAAMDLIADPGKHGARITRLINLLGTVWWAAAGVVLRRRWDVQRQPPQVQCGMNQSTVCSDPNAAVSWDGFHFTEHAYKVIADGMLRGAYAVPPIPR